MEKTKTYQVGIVGYTGMVGQEITKILERHSRVVIGYRRNTAGEEGRMEDCDILFLATKDLASMEAAQEGLAAGCRIIDMSGAFRLSQEEFETWYHMPHLCPSLLQEAAYGLPALFPETIRRARLVANPGCYATSVILALRPLRNVITGEAVVVSTSGNSGARKTAESIADDVTYSFGHQHKHVPEMVRYSGVKVNFTPVVLRSVFRGINTNIYVRLRGKLAKCPPQEAQERLESMLRDAYAPEDLVMVVRDTKEQQYGTAFVNQTNRMSVKVRVEDGALYLNSCLDNLGKGAASQAVENMNLMLGLPRQEGIGHTYLC